MASPTNNLLLRLHKWATRQDENFLTEAFAHLLQFLLENEPELAVRFLGSLSGGFFSLRSEEAKTVDVSTQVSLETGRPDLRVKTGDQLAFIEVKSESAVSEDQIARYLGLLAESSFSSTALILLTRYPADLETFQAKPRCHARWYQVAEWIEQERVRYTLKPVSTFLVGQFLFFLGARNMVIEHVSWELSGGVRALSSLLNMLFETAAACKVTAKKSVSWDSLGLSLDGRKYWMGVDLADPEKLWFGTSSRIDSEAAACLGIGVVTEESWVPGGYRWWRAAELNSEDVHFFSKTKAGQMQWLEKFLRQCLAQARSIETPDQPPIPEEPHED